MSELYYRLTSQANILYYILSKKERNAITIRYINRQFEKIENSNSKREKRQEKEAFAILNMGLKLINEFNKLNFQKADFTNAYRREFAQRCRDLDKKVTKFLTHKIGGADYAALSNVEFEDLINEDVNCYFFISSSMNENSNRLLEYLLDRGKGCFN